MDWVRPAEKTQAEKREEGMALLKRIFESGDKPMTFSKSKHLERLENPVLPKAQRRAAKLINKQTRKRGVTIRNIGHHIGRNDPCPVGCEEGRGYPFVRDVRSRKFKNCKNHYRTRQVVLQ